MKQRDKNLLIELSNNNCEKCKKDFNSEDLEVHRVRRGIEGGTYHWRNCMVLCKDCHRKLHEREFKFISGGD